MSEHKVIWLQPDCEGCNLEEGRQWCQDDVGPCEECGKPWIRYVLAKPQVQRAKENFADDA